MSELLVWTKRRTMGLSRFCSQLKLLLWKNALLQRRSPVWTVFQIFTPVLFTVVMVALRQLTDPVQVEPTIYQKFRVAYEPPMLDPLNCFFPTAIAYAPNTSLTNQLMQSLTTAINRVPRPSGLPSIEFKARGTCNTMT